MAYLCGHYEPKNEANDIRMKQRIRNYKIINNQLYKQVICTPLLKCISAEEGKKLLPEIHKGICGTHPGAKTMTGKAFRQGFIGHQPKMTAKKLSNLVVIAKYLQAKEMLQQ
jgi:hypothetical protein